MQNNSRRCTKYWNSVWVFLRCLFREKGIAGRNIQVPWNLRGNMERQHGKSCWRIFSQKQTTWKERIKKWQSGKEQKTKDRFIHSLVYLPVKPWQCESICRIFAVLDSVLIRDRRAITIAALNVVEQNSQGVTSFSLVKRHSLEHHGGHSLCVEREGYLSHPTLQYPT